MIIEKNFEGVQLITLNHPNRHNPFNRELEEAIKEALLRANDDPTVKAIVVHGGDDRSFSVGGDFNEVMQLSLEVDIEEWVDRVIDLYIAVLQVDKPTFAAIGGYAIGMGFQFGIMFDQRFMASDACMSMPELKHGIGCSVGAAILAFTHGFITMQEIVYQCKDLDSSSCLQYKLVNRICKKEYLVEEAIAQARFMADYPVSSFKSTKYSMNQKFINLLEETRNDSKLVHTTSFKSKQAQHHFKNVLKIK